MKISARNQLPGTIVSVEEGAVNAIVHMQMAGEKLSGTISLAAVQELGLVPGKKAVAVIKATEVMVGLGEMRLSARNKFKGVVTGIKEGAVNDIVSLRIAGGNTVSATISKAAVAELGLRPGTDAVAVIKATSVMFAVED